MARPSLILSVVAALFLAAIFSEVANAFQFQAYSGNNFHGQARTYTQRGTFRPGFTIKSYRWDSPRRDGCCVKMCNGGAQVGYWCPSKSNGLPSTNFNKIVIGCNNEQLVC